MRKPKAWRLPCASRRLGDCRVQAEGLAYAVCKPKAWRMPCASRRLGVCRVFTLTVILPYTRIETLRIIKRRHFERARQRVVEKSILIAKEDFSATITPSVVDVSERTAAKRKPNYSRHPIIYQAQVFIRVQRPLPIKSARVGRQTFGLQAAFLKSPIIKACPRAYILV